MRQLAVIAMISVRREPLPISWTRLRA